MPRNNKVYGSSYVEHHLSVKKESLKSPLRIEPVTSARLRLTQSLHYQSTTSLVRFFRPKFNYMNC